MQQGTRGARAYFGVDRLPAWMQQIPRSQSPPDDFFVDPIYEDEPDLIPFSG